MKVDYIAKDAEEARMFADQFIETVNADHHDVIQIGRDNGCRIRDHIESLRRELGWERCEGCGAVRELHADAGDNLLCSECANLK